jgi:hypothetical protein
MRRGAAYGTHALATPLSEEHDALSHGRRVQTGAFITFAFRLWPWVACGCGGAGAAPARVAYVVPGTKTPGGAGTHTGHGTTGTRITQTNLTTIPTHTNARPRSRPRSRPKCCSGKKLKRSLKAGTRTEPKLGACSEGTNRRPSVNPRKWHP